MFRRFQLHRAELWVPLLFFSALLIIGIIIHRDYGLSWDDPVQRQLGLSTWDYALGRNTDLLQLINRYHNPFIEALQILPEKVLQPKSERAIYLSKHLFNFIFCWCGLIVFYLLALRLFKDFRYALLACLLFLLTPRLFAHCFYNSKDLPFLFLFVASIYFLVCWLEKPSWQNVAGMIITSGMLTGTRVLGVIIPVMILLAFVVSVGRRKMGWREGKMILVYFLLYPVSVYVFFPAIWPQPISGFFEALRLMSHFPFDVTTFFIGATVHSLQTPWYYMPVWMGITIPIGWWFFFTIGITTLIMVIFRTRFISLPWLIIILWLLLPVAAVIILHSNLYEDGRHLFFIYPPFLLIVAAGIRTMFQKSFTGEKFIRLFLPVVASGVLFITAVSIIAFMIRFHPHQHVYFNLAGRSYAADYFEKDYWGLSYRNALEFLVKYDRSDRIKVRWKVDPCEWNLAWLNGYDRQRIHVTSYNDCDYYITNYRSHRPVDASDEKLYEIRVQGFSIMAVYKMHPPNGSPNPLP